MTSTNAPSLPHCMPLQRCSVRNHGCGVPVGSRSAITALVVFSIVWFNRVAWRPNRRQLRGLLAVGVMIGIQSQCLYSSVARLPVALALLAFNTYPLFTALWDRVLYKNTPSRAMVLAMPVILLGLGLALDVLGAASGLGASTQWAQMGAGVAFALAAAASFGLALILTQHETQGLDGRGRTHLRGRRDQRRGVCETSRLSQTNQWTQAETVVSRADYVRRVPPRP